MKKIVSLLILVFTIVSCQAQKKEQAVQLLPPDAFAKEMATHKGQVIDVRTPKEYRSGYIEGAVNMHIYDADFEQRAEKLKKDEPVYVYCKAGSRSAEAVEVFKAKGFNNIVELEGGMDSWNEAGKPVKQ